MSLDDVAYYSKILYHRKLGYFMSQHTTKKEEQTDGSARSSF